MYVFFIPWSILSKDCSSTSDHSPSYWKVQLLFSLSREHSKLPSTKLNSNRCYLSRKPGKNIVTLFTELRNNLVCKARVLAFSCWWCGREEVSSSANKEPNAENIEEKTHKQKGLVQRTWSQLISRMALQLVPGWEGRDSQKNCWHKTITEDANAS